MQSQEKDNLIVVRLFPGENVIEQLKVACLKHNIKTGVIVSGIGQLASVEVGFFKEKGNYTPQKIESPSELLSFSGFMSVNEKNEHDFHLHTVLCNESKNAFGGHFIGGIVSVTFEIAILKSEIDAQRKIEENTGLNGMFLE